MEYVCDLDRESVSEVSQGVIGVKLVTIDEVTAIHERVIRCRDCGYCEEAEMRDGYDCWRDPDHTGHATPTQLDGFCAWAKSKEDA